MSSSLGVALVTGAARGIGRSIALRLARDGFDVAVNDLPAAAKHLNAVRQEIVDKGGKASVIAGDVSTEADVENMVSSTVKELGQLNVMVANAGICKVNPITEISVEEWDNQFSVNGRGTMLCYKHAARQMIKQGSGGRIIGASSVAGRRGEGVMAAYSATKFAVRGLTQAAATELGPHGITVNVYCPGVTETDMLDKLVGGPAGATLEGLLEHFASDCPARRNGTTDDVAHVVSFLASKESSWITGQTLGVDGGRYY